MYLGRVVSVLGCGVRVCGGGLLLVPRGKEVEVGVFPIGVVCAQACAPPCNV